MSQERLLAISNSEQAHSGIIFKCSWHGEVDIAIFRHGEPHVVRVAVDCLLSTTEHQKILLISRGSYLSEDLEVGIGPVVAAVTTVHSSMDEDCPRTGGDDTGDGEGDSTSFLQI